MLNKDAQAKLDAFVDIYLRASELDNKRTSTEEKARANEILVAREKALGITGEHLDNLLDKIDSYAESETEYGEVESLFDLITK